MTRPVCIVLVLAACWLAGWLAGGVAAIDTLGPDPGLIMRVQPSEAPVAPWVWTTGLVALVAFTLTGAWVLFSDLQAYALRERRRPVLNQTPRRR